MLPYSTRNDAKMPHTSAVLHASETKVDTFWVMSLCNLVGWYERFGWAHNLQDRSTCSEDCGSMFLRNTGTYSPDYTVS
jgi:hypothetical protein